MTRGPDASTGAVPVRPAPVEGNGEGRLPRRLFVVLAAVVVVTIVTAGFAWGSYAVPTPIAPPIVRVTGTSWSVRGCDVENVTGPGVVTAEGSVFEVNATIENLDPSASCVLSPPDVSTAGFALVAADTPGTLGPAGSTSAAGTVYATVRAPQGWVTSAVALVIPGTQGSP